MNIKKVLIPIDLDRDNLQIFKFAFDLKSRTGATLLFLHCFHPNLKEDDMIEEMQEIKLSKMEETILAYGEDKIDDFDEIEAIASFAVDGIIERANSEAFDLVILGYDTGAGLGTFSVGIEVIDKIDAPVLIIPDKYRYNKLHHIAFNIEFEFREIDSVYKLLVFANRFGAFLSCAHFDGKLPPVEIAKNINTYKKMFEYECEKELIEFENLHEKGTQALIDFALDFELDLICMYKTRKTWKQYFNPTNEEKLLKKLAIPVLLINR